MSKSKIYGVLGAVIFMSLLFLLLWFVYITYTPPQEDEGIEVAIVEETPAPIPFGGEEEGANAYSEQVAQSPEPQAPAPAPQVDPVPAKSAPAKEVMTQEDPSVVAARKRKAEEERQRLETERQERLAREKALAEQRAKEEAAARAKAEREAKEKAAKEKAGQLGGLLGSMGQTGGLGNGSGNTAKGNPAGHGNSGGNSWSLNGRNLKGSLSVPQADYNQPGVVVVEIRVNAAGQVIMARVGQGTNTSDKALQEAAIQAARKATFSTGDGDVVGTITYRFQVN